VTHLIEVAPAPGFADPRSSWVLARARELGLGADSAEVSRLYRIEGSYGEAELERAARELLADPVTESFKVGSAPVPAGACSIEVWYRPNVTDPASESVEKGIRDLGLAAPDRVRCGRKVTVAGPLGRSGAQVLAEKVLANPVVHEWRIQL